MTISVTEIRELREKTDAGMMDCKTALIECSGDVNKSIVWLRKKGLANIKKRGAKDAAEGTVGLYVHTGGKLGVLVEVNCETDFVAKGEVFQKFAKELAMHVAASNPQWVNKEEVPSEILKQEKEVISSTLDGKPSHVIEKIINGKINKFYKENCLMEQQFVRDINLTIKDLLGELASKVGEKIIIKRFARFVIGE